MSGDALVLKTTTLDATHLKGVADRLNNTRESRRVLRSLDAEFSVLLAGAPSGTARSPRLAPDKPTVASGKPWIGPQVATLSVNQRDEREKAAQRAFFCHGEVTVGAQRLVLLDMEFDTRPDTNRIDLLGMPDDAADVRCVVELKYADTRSADATSLGDSPVKAMLQALAYAVRGGADARRGGPGVHRKLGEGKPALTHEPVDVIERERRQVRCRGDRQNLARARIPRRNPAARGLAATFKSRPQRWASASAGVWRLERRPLRSASSPLSPDASRGWVSRALENPVERAEAVDRDSLDRQPRGHEAENE